MHSVSPEIPAPAHPSDSVSTPRLRIAGERDLDLLLRLEEQCFEEARRDSRATIRRALRHESDEVWVVDADEGLIQGSLVLRHLRKGLRLYSLAVHPETRGYGLGNFLLDKAIARGTESSSPCLFLEADAGLPGLLNWYERHGFTRDRFLPDFYAPGHDAWRLKLCLRPATQP